MGNTIEDLKKCELEIFKEFIRVCDILKLNYFIAGGTLIGAIRHKGFIPWDDDIDICMLREDYEKFIERAPKYLKKEFFLQTYDSDKNYINSFAKIRNNNTTFIEKNVKNISMNHGVFIDVFPIDNLYNINKFKLKIIQKFLNCIYKRDTIKICKLICIFLKILMGKNFKNILCRMKDKIYKKKNNVNTEKVICYSGAWGLEKESHLREDFENFTIVEFENIKVKAPIGYDRILRDTYGDYMKLPPKEKRISHHGTEIIDIQKSYLEYIK